MKLDKEDLSKYTLEWESWYWVGAVLWKGDQADEEGE